MYETFYQLTATPFRLMPDPEFCFRHSGYTKAHAYLQYAYELGEGFVILTGRPGTGKTTLIESFLKELETDNASTARIAVANLVTNDLMRWVAFVYGIEAEGLDKATLLRKISEHFTSLMHDGRRVLLIIDEAQGLSHNALEELRLLADLKEGVRPLLQILLVGQEKLRSIMREPDMEQLQQRVIGTCRLGSMELTETNDYIRHRLCRAGWKGDPELTEAAILAIFKYSGGIPRHVNKICTRLLLLGFMEHKHVLEEDDVLNIANEMDEELLSPVNNRQTTPEQAAGDADLTSESQHNSISLSDLAVRALQHEGDTETPSVSSKAETSMPATNPHNGPSLAHESNMLSPSISSEDDRAQMPHIDQSPMETDRVTETCGPARGYIGSIMRQARHSVCNAAWYRQSIFVVRALPSLLKLQEKPAVLFGVVAVATIAAATVTSYIESHAVQHEITGSNVGTQIWRPSDSISAVAAEVQHTVKTDQGNSEYNTAAQRAGNDNDTGTQENVESVSFVTSKSRSALLQDQFVSNGQTQVMTSEHSPDIASYAADTVITSSSDPAVSSVTPTVGDSSNSPIRGQEAMVSLATANKSVSELLSLGAEAIREDRLLIPEQHCAYYYYQQVLSREPANFNAVNGLEQIVLRYEALARQAIHHQDKTMANRFIARGLYVRPRDKRLLALKSSIITMSVNEQPLYQTSAAPLEFAPDEAKKVKMEKKVKQSKNVFLRLKDFFTREPTTSEEEW